MNNMNIVNSIGNKITIRTPKNIHTKYEEKRFMKKFEESLESVKKFDLKEWEVREIDNVDVLKHFYDDWAMTIGGHSLEYVVFWIENLAGGLMKNVIYKCEGKMLNTIFDLSDGNRYPEDYIIYVIDDKHLNNILYAHDIRLATWGIARFLIDVIDNDLKREGIELDVGEAFTYVEEKYSDIQGAINYNVA